MIAAPSVAGIRSPQPQHVLHVVVARGSIREPFGGTERAFRERHAAGRPVRELNAFAVASEKHGVVAHDVAAAHGMDADFATGARADDALTAVNEVVLGAVRGFAEDFGQTDGGAARSVLLLVVVRLDDLHVEIIGEERGGLAGEVEEEVLKKVMRLLSMNIRAIYQV